MQSSISSHRLIILAPVPEAYKGHVLSTQLGIKKKLASSRLDFSMMKHGFPIDHTVVTRGEFDTVTLELCARFIFNDANVQQIYLGKKQY